MNLSLEDLRHCHKVLWSDIEEIEILTRGSSGGLADRLQKRAETNKRIIARIERIIGCVPIYNSPKDVDNG